MGRSVAPVAHQTTEILLRSRIFDVERRTIDDGEHQITREVVVHPGAVAILPVLSDGRIVMIRNQRFTVGRQLLEIPAGTLEPGESPAECAARELEEETGYRSQQIEPLTEIFTSPGVLTERMWIYTAHQLTKTKQNLQSDERIVVDIMEASELKKLICNGEIEDGKTVAALATWLLRCESGSPGSTNGKPNRNRYTTQSGM